jgi:hypothetical protein
VRAAGPEGGPFVARVAGLLADPGVAEHLARTARFYGARLGAADTLAFVLLYRPAGDGDDAGTRGQQLARSALVEFVPGEPPEARFDVAIHELCHYLYQRAPLADATALYARFLASGRPAAVPAYNLLDEVLASAVGNGLMARRRLPPAAFDSLLARPGALYDRDEVDRGAKAVLPWLAPWVEAGRTLHDPAFVPAYLDRIERALGPRPRRPAGAPEPHGARGRRRAGRRRRARRAPGAPPVVVRRRDATVLRRRGPRRAARAAAGERPAGRGPGPPARAGRGPAAARGRPGRRSGAPGDGWGRDGHRAARAGRARRLHVRRHRPATPPAPGARSSAWARCRPPVIGVVPDVPSPGV